MIVRFFERLKEKVGHARAERLRAHPKEASFTGLNHAGDLSYYIPLWKAAARTWGYPLPKWKCGLGLLDEGEVVGSVALEDLEENFVPTDELTLAAVKNALNDYTRWCCTYRLNDLAPGKTRLVILAPHAIARQIKLASVETGKSMSEFVVDGMRPLLKATSR